MAFYNPIAAIALCTRARSGYDCRRGQNPAYQCVRCVPSQGSMHLLRCIF